MQTETIGLWKRGRITGIWTHERTCKQDEAAQWLAIFKRTEPGETFKLSKRKPKP